MPKNNKRPLSSSIDDVFLSVLSLYHSIDLSSLNSISQGATNYQFFQLPNDDVLALKNRKNFFSRISFQRRRACESLMRIMLMVFIFLQTLFLEVPFLSLWNVDWSVFTEWKGESERDCMMLKQYLSLISPWASLSRVDSFKIFKLWKHFKVLRWTFLNSCWNVNHTFLLLPNFIEKMK